MLQMMGGAASITCHHVVNPVHDLCAPNRLMIYLILYWPPFTPRLSIENVKHSWCSLLRHRDGWIFVRNLYRCVNLFEQWRHVRLSREKMAVQFAELV
jgi:hypothetical protein